MNKALSSPGPSAAFLSFLKEGKFKLQRSTRTGEYFFYPRSFTAGAGSEELEWVEVTGRGTVYSTTTVRQKPEHGGDYNLAIVALEEGPKMLTRIVNIDPAKVQIGMSVRAIISQPTWKSDARQPLVIFIPEENLT